MIKVKISSTEATVKFISAMEKDTVIVNIASNYFRYEPTCKTKRFCQVQKKKLDVPPPHLIKMYNEVMGGVNLLDKLLVPYRFMFRSKKWYCNLFSNSLNMVVAGGWILHLHLHKITTAELSPQFPERKSFVLFSDGIKNPFCSLASCTLIWIVETIWSTLSYAINTMTMWCMPEEHYKKDSECEKRLHEKYFPNYHRR